jgi:hypothetical protein
MRNGKKGERIEKIRIEKVKQMQYREELSEKGTMGVGKKLRLSAKNIFGKGVGINIVLRSKYRPLANLLMFCAVASKFIFKEKLQTEVLEPIVFLVGGIIQSLGVTGVLLGQGFHMFRNVIGQRCESLGGCWCPWSGCPWLSLAVLCIRIWLDPKLFAS